MAEESDKEIEAHRKNLQSVYWAIQGGRTFEMRTDSAHAQAIIWASERIAELEAESPLPETGSDENRGLFFRLGGGCELDCELDAATYCEAVAWGQNRIRHLERDRRDVQELLNQNSAIVRENEQLSLENENLSKTILTLSKSPQLASPDPDEETHQRRRRERMLDEITLICVRDGIERLKGDQTEEKGCGFLARDIADKLCYGIDKWDAT